MNKFSLEDAQGQASDGWKMALYAKHFPHKYENPSLYPQNW